MASFFISRSCRISRHANRASLLLHASFSSSSFPNCAITRRSHALDVQPSRRIPFFRSQARPIGVAFHTVVGTEVMSGSTGIEDDRSNNDGKREVISIGNEAVDSGMRTPKGDAATENGTTAMHGNRTRENDSVGDDMGVISATIGNDGTVDCNEINACTSRTGTSICITVTDNNQNEMKDDHEVDAGNVLYGLDFDHNTSFMVMDVANKLGITDFQHLCTVEALRNSTEKDIFERLSFLTNIGISGEMSSHIISMQPLYMSVDLGKQLYPVVTRLESLGLAKVFLGKVLATEPALLPLFTERALQVRIRALRDLDFSREDCATFLKSLQYKQFGQFLRYPTEKFETALTFMNDEIGIKTGEAIKLLKNHPSVLLRDVNHEFVSKMGIIKTIFDDERSARKVFVHVPELLGRNTESLEETIEYLRSMMDDDKELKKLLESFPNILMHTKSGMEQVSKYLQALGFSNKRLLGLIAREPYLVSCETRRLQKHVEFLKSKNLDEEAICNLIENSTLMFFKSLEKRVAPKIEFLEKQGITGGSLQKLMKLRPHVYKKSLRNTMEPNLEFLLSLGLKENSSSLKTALKITLQHSRKDMQSRIDFLNRIGIEIADVHNIVRDNPSVLVMSISSLKKRIEFLVKIMKLPIEELLKCPSFLMSDIDNVVKPRVRVLDWLKSQGLVKRVSLSTLVEASEAIFMKQFVEGHPQASSIYKGTQL